MRRYWLMIVAIALFSATRLGNATRIKNFLVVWNVGQGQWATQVQAKHCLHFDMGGEKNPLSKVRHLCASKKNFIYLSHWDWDHISFALKARKSLPDSCLLLPPLGTSSFRKMKILKAYPLCAPEEATRDGVQELTSNLDSTKKSNDLSHVLLIRNQWLIPGDSGSGQEKIWSEVSEIRQTKFLLLGHHGSRTSTSEILLQALPVLKMAIASARFEKYGHPHQEVALRLRRHQVPLLKTEDWGNLWFEER